jgi:hypothetical protein
MTDYSFLLNTWRKSKDEVMLYLLKQDNDHLYDTSQFFKVNLVTGEKRDMAVARLILGIQKIMGE